jgi:hypothetical protein
MRANRLQRKQLKSHKKAYVRDRVNGKTKPLAHFYGFIADYDSPFYSDREREEIQRRLREMHEARLGGVN